MSAVIAANPIRSDTVVRLPNSGSQPLSSSTLMGHFSYSQLSPNQGTAMDLFLLHHWLRQALPCLTHLLLYTGGSPQDCRFFSLPGVSAGQVSAQLWWGWQPRRKHSTIIGGVPQCFSDSLQCRIGEHSWWPGPGSVLRGSLRLAGPACSSTLPQVAVVVQHGMELRARVLSHSWTTGVFSL